MGSAAWCERGSRGARCSFRLCATAFSAVALLLWIGILEGPSSRHRTLLQTHLDDQSDIIKRHWLAEFDTSSPEDIARGGQFLWLLPPGARLFCPSYDADPAMAEVVLPRHPDVVIGAYSTGCPAPISMFVLERGYTDGWLARPPLGLLKQPLGLWRHAIVSMAAAKRSPSWQRHAAGIEALNRSGTRGFDKFFHSDMESAVVAEYCVALCLRSPYCQLVQLSGRRAPSTDGENRSCLLFHNDVNSPVALESVVEPRRQDGVMFAFAFRREVRPSLVVSHWRLSVFGGPDDVVRIENSHLHCEECIWWLRVEASRDLWEATASIPGRRPAVAPQQSWSVNATVSVAVSQISRRHAVEALSTNASPSLEKSFVLMNYTVTLTGAKNAASVDLRSLEVVPFLVGSWMAISVTCSTISSRHSRFAQLVPLSCSEVTAARWSFMVQYTAHDMQLLLDTVPAAASGGFWSRDPPPALPTSAWYGLQPSAAGNAASSPYVVHGSACAPLLRTDECCFRGLVVHHVSVRSRRVHDASHRERSGTMVFLRSVLSDGRNFSWIFSARRGAPSSDASGEPLPCVRLVDGHYGPLNNSGIALFPNLVVKIVCTRSEMMRRISSKDERERKVHFQATPFEGPVIGVPLSHFLGCSGADEDLAKSNARRIIAKEKQVGLESTTGQKVSETDTAGDSDNRPIFVSTCVYECARCVLQLVQNIRAFIPGSVIVVRITGRSGISEHEEQWLREQVKPMALATPLGLTQQVLIYRAVYPAAGLHLAHLHGLNIRFIEEREYCKQYNASSVPQCASLASRAVPFYQSYSHVLFMSSNELLVRFGADAYMKRHNLSSGNGLPSQGFLLRQASRKRRVDRVTFMSDTDQQRYGSTFIDWGRPERAGVTHEFHLAAVMRLFNMTRWPREQVYLEGSFFSRPLAVLYADILLTLFDAAALPLADGLHNSSGFQFAIAGWYATSEIVPYMFFHHLCADEVDDPLAHSSAVPHAAAQADDALLFSRAAVELLQRWRGFLPGSMSCGQRVTTVVWANLGWAADLADVRLVRCSPFEVPFGFKRVARDERNHVRRHVAALQADPQRRTALREDREGYCGAT
jgi:hypothetical protein